MIYRKPKPDSWPMVHERVLEVLKTEKRGKLLDAGAGKGILTEKIVKMGFEVQACDFNPDRFELKNLLCKKVDLQKKLPYENEYFDIILCVEVIEHLHDPWHIISELSRILKKNGKLIISTPNILALQARLHFLMFGEHILFENYLLWHKPKNLYEMLDVHITPVSFPQLVNILTNNTMKLEITTINRRYPKHIRLFHGFLSYQSRRYLLSRILHPFIKRRMKRYFNQFENRMFISDQLLDDLLTGEILIIKAIKV